jgi:WD40 repeat protein
VKPSPGDVSIFTKLLSALDDDAFVVPQTDAAPTPAERGELDDTPAQIDDSRLDRGIKCLKLLNAVGGYERGLAELAAMPELSSNPASADENSPNVTIGRFEILGELGRGGCGVVFMANDPALQRVVALKVPRPEHLFSAESRRRFMDEARLAAGLRHRHIVTVYEVGSDGPVCWYAAEYCNGPSLREVIQRQKTTIPVRAAVQIVKQLADAIAHAHFNGVLHRDLKPGNVLLTREASGALEQANSPIDATSAAIANATSTEDIDWSDENLVPKLTDFGLAKLYELDQSATQTGNQLGTPAYMAPEQVEGNKSKIGPATDVYGLGAILYELLAGVAPFRGESNAELFSKVLHANPLALHLLRSDVPRDVQAIVVRCLEKSPARRYASAGELANDLRRFLAGESTIARPLGWVARTHRWIRRNQMAAALLIVVFLSVMVMVAGGAWHLYRLNKELAIIQQQRSALRQEKYITDMQLAGKAWEQGKLEPTLATLTNYLPGPGDVDLRDFAWHYLWNRCHMEELRLAEHTGPVCAAKFSPDDKLIATASHDGTARIWDAKTGVSLAVLRGHQGNVNCLSFMPDGKLLFTGADDGALKVWTVPNGELLATVPRHQGDMLCLAVHPEGKFVATAGVDSVIRLWEVDQRKHVGDFTGHDKWVRGLVFSPDGLQLFSAGHDSTVRAWDVSTQQQIWSTIVDDKSLSCIASRRNRPMLAVGSSSGEVYMLNRDDGLVTDSVKSEQGWVRGVRFCNDSNHLYAVGTVPVLRYWGLSGSKLQGFRRNLGVHTDVVWSVDYSADGTRVLTASNDGTAKVWRCNSAKEDASEIVTDLASSLSMGAGMLGDGNRVVVAYSNCLEIWDIALRKRVAQGVGTGNAIADLAVAADESWVATAGSERLTEIWDLTSWKRKAVLPEWAGQAESIATHPKNNWIAVAKPNQPLRVWDVDSQRIVEELPFASTDLNRLVRFSPDGRLLLVGHGHRLEICVWDRVERREILRKSCGQLTVSFSGDSTKLAWCGRDHTVRVKELFTNSNELRLTRPENRLRALVFTPTGKQIACTRPDGMLELWDIATGKMELEVTFQKDANWLRFTNGGRSLVAGGNSTIRILPGTDPFAR